VAITLRVTELEVQCDSSLIINQVSGEYVARDSQMADYLQLVLKLKTEISRCDFKWLPRSTNNHADSLVNLGVAVESSSGEKSPSSISLIQASSNW